MISPLRQTLKLFTESCCGLDSEATLPEEELFDRYAEWVTEQLVVDADLFAVAMMDNGFKLEGSDWIGLTLPKRDGRSRILAAKESTKDQPRVIDLMEALKESLVEAKRKSDQGGAQ